MKVGEPIHVRARTAVTLTLEVDYPLSCWYRIETQLGEVHRDSERLMYEASSEGEEPLDVTAIGSDGHTARVVRTFRVSEVK